MHQVLLKREWRTPLGRFGRSVNGEPTPVPDVVVERFPLPRDATVVDETYVPPSQREPGHEVSTQMTAAEIEAEINRRVNAEVALREAKARGQRHQGRAEAAEAAAARKDEVKPRSPGAEPAASYESEVEAEPKVESESPAQEVDASVLDRSVKALISGALEGLGVAHLRQLRALELSGRNRKGALVAIEAALEDLGGG